MRITRSRLIIPINVKKFVNNSYKRNADAIVLDLEDSIPYDQKEIARDLIRSAVKPAAAGGNRLYIRVNAEKTVQKKDIHASVLPEVHGVILPKVETREDIGIVDEQLDQLDPEQRIQISVLIETSKGIRNIDAILSASTRIESVSLGAEDLASELNLGNGPQREELLRHVRYTMLLSAKAHHVQPLALMGSISNYKDVGKVREAAVNAYQLGFEGNSCIHPGQVQILNDSFSPDKETAEEAQRLIEVFEESVAQGRASMVFKDKMIDYPHYEQAKQLVEFHNDIIAFETKKADARKRWEEMQHEEGSS
ncbi:HpcH/HpaI aldolase/citrate lyase family protein [Shouchella shacheensis]|uniref:HpcH/HpaI aldolase/citrate lyase family protein n=1 Tax=Shouchella shacheensis TaxID=1649580 RepID=UPI00073FCE20|nr:CoA ester lyase [Shouchella shacheensis]